MMMSVEITINEGGLRPGKPVPLFDAGSYNRSYPLRSYDVTPDGQRFLMVKLMERGEREAIRNKDYFGNRVSIVLNWFEELKRTVPTN